MRWRDMRGLTGFVAKAVCLPGSETMTEAVRLHCVPRRIGISKRFGASAAIGRGEVTGCPVAAENNSSHSSGIQSRLRKNRLRFARFVRFDLLSFKSNPKQRLKKE